jgi:hypothetical protein
MLSKYDDIRAPSVGSWMVPSRVPGTNTLTLAGGRTSGSGAQPTFSVPLGSVAAAAHVRAPVDTVIE